MHRRRWSRPLALAPLAALALVLGACSSGGSGSGAASSSGASSSAAGSAGPTATTLDAVTVTPATGGQGAPEVTVSAPLAVQQTLTDVITAGTGPAVEAGDLVDIDFVGVDGATGKRFGATEFNGQPASFLLGDGVIKGFTTALTGRAQGSRVLVAVPPAEGYGPAGGLSQAGIGADDTIVYLVDITGVRPGWATGEPVAPPAGLPAVSVDPVTHATTIAAAQGQPPSGLQVHTLVKGAGPVVQAGQSTTVMYTGVVWGSSDAFDTSWSKGTALTFPLGAGQVIKGWDQGLAGQTVGSQVLLVIPPDLGYGAEGSGETIPGGATLVFAVDILDASDATATPAG